MGRRHAENVRRHPELRLVAVADVVARTAEVVARELECPFWSTDPHEAIARPDCQAVIIATTAETHADLTAYAASRKRDVLCEKPLALTLPDAQRAVEATAAAGVRLHVGFMRRFDPGYAEAKRRIDAGDIGTPVIFKAISRDPVGLPLARIAAGGSGGIFLDSAIHDYDLARWLMSSEVARVSTLATRTDSTEHRQTHPDAGFVHMWFASGAVGDAEVFNNVRYGYDIRTEIIGTQGTLRVGFSTETGWALLTSDSQQTGHVMGFLDRFAVAYDLEVRDWARRMLSDQPAAITGEDGLRALAIAIAARQSGQTESVVGVA
jgi:predicted dehydrogenase